MMAVLRCRALQRPARAAMLRDCCMCSFGRGGPHAGSLLARAPRNHRGRSLNRHPESRGQGRRQGDPRSAWRRADRRARARAGAARRRARRARRAAAPAASRVEGEPGIGKTRLLAELRAPRRGARLPRARPARPPSSSATCRSASGSTRSTPTSPPRSSTLRERWDAEPGRRARRRSCRRCAAPARGAPARSPTSATARTARCAGCSSCWPTSARSCSCSTTCTGATARRSS